MFNPAPAMIARIVLKKKFAYQPAVWRRFKFKASIPIDFPAEVLFSFAGKFKLTRAICFE